MPQDKNTQLTELIKSLRVLSAKEKNGIWKRIASELERPTRQRRVVNVYLIDKESKENETVIVPGKVLGVGELSKRVNVAAFQFSEEAMRKIKGKGEAITIQQLISKNPSGKGVRILG